MISYGLSSFGYDARLDANSPLMIFDTHYQGGPIDPKRFDERCLRPAELLTNPDDGSQYWWIPAHKYCLGLTVETFNIPRNVTGIAYGKSTYARCGVEVNITPLEAGWSGRLVVEFSNAADLPVKVYANEGFLQILFAGSDNECVVSYADRAGKYQNQTELTLAKL